MQKVPHISRRKTKNYENKNITDTLSKMAKSITDVSSVCNTPCDPILSLADSR